MTARSLWVATSLFRKPTTSAKWRLRRGLLVSRIAVFLVDLIPVAFYPGIGVTVFVLIRKAYWRERRKAEAKGLVWPEA